MRYFEIKVTALGVPTNNEPCMYCFNELLQARAAAEMGKAL